jgi:uncharacterized protein (DUF3820 family)
MRNHNEPLTDDSPMPFGKYQGTRMIDVPDKYLLHLHETGKYNAQVQAYIEDNLDAIKANAERAIN